jgi:hypothetical protein
LGESHSIDDRLHSAVAETCQADITSLGHRLRTGCEKGSSMAIEGMVQSRLTRPRVGAIVTAAVPCILLCFPMFPIFGTLLHRTRPAARPPGYVLINNIRTMCAYNSDQLAESPEKGIEKQTPEDDVLPQSHTTVLVTTHCVIWLKSHASTSLLP